MLMEVFDTIFLILHDKQYFTNNKLRYNSDFNYLLIAVTIYYKKMN